MRHNTDTLNQNATLETVRRTNDESHTQFKIISQNKVKDKIKDRKTGVKSAW